MVSAGAPEVLSCSDRTNAQSRGRYAFWYCMQSARLIHIKPQQVEQRGEQINSVAQKQIYTV